MRITANMLSEATVQAGIQMGGNSLVNYLNGEESDSLVCVGLYCGHVSNMHDISLNADTFWCAERNARNMFVLWH